LLVLLPPVLWFCSLLSIGLVPTYILGANDVTAMGALTMVAPMAFLMLLALGYVGMYFEQVLIDAAAGDVHHPRLPAWSITGCLISAFRLVICLVTGFVVPGFLALAYWLNCGDLDWADRVILVMILTPGAVYAQVALAAVVLHDDLRAANPVTVLSALGRVGTSAITLAIGLAVPLALTALMVPALLSLPGWQAAFATYVFWVILVYEGMVMAWVLGAFCRHHSQELGWFADRPQWGVRG
jgi:hypothetical protein